MFWIRTSSHLFSPSVIKSLDLSNPVHQVWLDYYNEGKHGLIYHEVYERIPRSQYLALNRAGKIRKAIPSIYVFVIKNDKDDKPPR